MRWGQARNQHFRYIGSLGLCEWWVYDLEWSSSSMFKHLQSNSYRYHVPCSTRLDATTCYLQICSGPAHMDSLVLSLCWSLAPGKDERLQSWKRMKWKSRLYFCRWNYHETQDCDMTSLLCQEDTKLWHDFFVVSCCVDCLYHHCSQGDLRMACQPTALPRMKICWTWHCGSVAASGQPGPPRTSSFNRCGLLPALLTYFKWYSSRKYQ